MSPYDSNYDSYSVSEHGSGKEMTLKKVYELALTAIAYLAFGIFILQVIMCITTVRFYKISSKHARKENFFFKNVYICDLRLKRIQI